ncbi:MAG: hypothetical protein EA393_00480 [Bacteroidetes bacterium]|nr:MAG: hypothetical protein EA393_00480 [Bacteroidota bacterium]
MSSVNFISSSDDTFYQKNKNKNNQYRLLIANLPSNQTNNINFVLYPYPFENNTYGKVYISGKCRT